MRALPMAASRGAIACAAAVPRRSLLLSTAVAGAALQSEPIRLSSRMTSGTAKPRASLDAAQAATAFSSKEDAVGWAKKDNRRLHHVVYRVGDIDRTIKFYTECLGMKLLRKSDIPEEKYTNAFLGYGPEDSNFVAELTYSYLHYICVGINGSS